MKNQMTEFRCKKLLVTGGAGFIGSNFIHYLINKYKDVNIYNLDLLTYAGDLDNTKSFKSNKKYKFIHGDICDRDLLDEIFKKYDIDGVINFAAETHVDNSIIYPEKFIKTNIDGTFNLLNNCYKYWMKEPFLVKNKFNGARFHQISTDEVYGSIENGSFKEDDLYLPNSPYSSSKAASDLIVRSFEKTYGLNTTISICSNNYGKNQNREKLIPKIIHCLMNDEDIPIYGNGKNVRDWIHVEDHCRAIDLIFNKSENGHKYNIGGCNEYSNNEIVNLIIKFFKKYKSTKSKIKYVEDRRGHDFRYSIDSSKIKRNTDWSPKIEFLTGIDELINDFIEK